MFVHQFVISTVGPTVLVSNRFTVELKQTLAPEPQSSKHMCLRSALLN
jgi:hypothetical protein